MGRKKTQSVEVSTDYKPEAAEMIVPALKPAVLPTAEHADLLTPESTFEPRPGEYHMVVLLPDGSEKPGSDFSIGANTYNRTFKDNPQFRLKKNPKS